MVSLLLVRQEISVSGAEPSKQTFRVKRPIVGPTLVREGGSTGNGPGVPIVELNFINGVYQINGVNYSAGDVVDHPEYIDGTGLAIPTGGLVTSVIGEALANWPLGDWSGILRWNNFASSQTFTPLVIGNSGHDSGIQVSREVSLVAEIQDYNGAVSRLVTGGTAGIGQHTIAMTRENDLLAMSLDGSPVAGNNAPSFSISASFAAFGGFPSGVPVFNSVKLTTTPGASNLSDINGDGLAIADYPSQVFTIWGLPGGNVRSSVNLGYFPSGVFISSLGDVLVGDKSTTDVYVYDLVTGAQLQVISGVGQSLPSDNDNSSCETAIGPLAFILMAREDQLSLLKNAKLGLGWGQVWTLPLVGKPKILACSPSRVYWADADVQVLHYSGWSPTSGAIADASLVPPGMVASEVIRAVHYDENSDSVIVISNKGHIWVYSPDMGTVLRSINNGGWVASGVSDQVLSMRMVGGPDLLVFAAPEDSRIVEYRISDLALVNNYPVTAGGGTWGVNSPGVLSGVSAQFGVVFEPIEGYLLFLPPKAVIGDALTIECLRIFAPQDEAGLPGMSRQSCGPFVPPVPPPLVTEGQFSVLTGNFLQVIDLIGPAPMPADSGLVGGPDDRREGAVAKLKEWD